MPRLPFSPRRAALLFLLVLAGLCALAYLNTDLRALAAWADGDVRAHADTLGVAGAIYVPSLAHRGDRRAAMRALAGRLGARLTFVDAADARGPAVRNILDHVRVLRQAPPAEFAWPPGGAPPLDWTAPVLGADTLDRRVPLTCNWDNVTIRPFSRELPNWDVLNAGKVACWESHVAVLRRVAAAPWRAGSRIRAADVAIVLEDDVDLELDIGVRLAGLWPHLPKAWDMVFLGWCWSGEWGNAPIGEFTPPGTAQPNALRPSTSPQCTHAYAVSVPGARRLLAHLEHPPFAYSRAIDQAYAWLVRSGRVAAYSATPQLAVQRKADKSDISTWEPHWEEALYNPAFAGVEVS